LNLTTTSSFGPYEIVGPLGAGGMGEVYRARDTRLQRIVALKVLRGTYARDPSQGARLLHEARAASALNHPNILVVYDVGTEGEVPFIVSELVDGARLREVLSRGPLSVKELLDIAVQIADGLTAAHEVGLVHRDIKPENVMVTPDGRVKILDFGVAKIEMSAESVAGNIPTDTADELISGTAPYMSPEQARGRGVDFRSDQFAFGLVLYEMATGKRAFFRETPVQTLSAIIEDDPTPLVDVNPRLPLLLRWIIERCLAKDPRQRYAATADLARDLRTLRDRLAEASAVSAATFQPVQGRARRWPIGVAAAFCSVAGMFWLMSGARSGQPPRLTFTPLSSDFSYQGQPAWSPQGNMVAYTAEKDGVLQIFKRSLDSSQSWQVTHSTFDCRDPFWSPDSTRIYYISLAGEKDGVFSVGTAGGPPELVMRDAVTADLSPDGSTLAFLRDDGEQGGSALRLWLASPANGDPHRYTHGAFAERVFSDGLVRFSPDGSKLGLWAKNWASYYGMGRTSALWVVPMNGTDPWVATNILGDLPNYPPYFDWLSDGRRVVAAVEGRPSQGLHLWIIDTTNGPATALTEGAASENTPAVSPDGRRIAYAAQDANFDLVEIPIDGSPPRPLFVTSRNEMEPTWSPTKAEYAFVTDRRGRSEIWRRSRDGTLDLPVVTEQDFPERADQTLRMPAFSPDGTRIAFERVVPTSGSTIWITTLTGGTPAPLIAGKGTNTAPTWSPDGAWIAVALGTPQGWSLVKARVGVATPPVVIRDHITPFAHPQWSPDDQWIACNTPQGLTLLTPDGKMARVLDEDMWPAYGWSRDGSSLYGIKQDPDNLHRFLLAAVDIRSGRRRIINPNLAPVPPVNAPLKGFTRVSDTSFATSFVHVRSDLWLIEDFLPPSSFLDRLRAGRAVSR
jgi:serine/threonine protein kinase/sugar lactone lactonase YvrE